MLSPFSACPGLFYTTPAKDGIICRIRIPGGILNSEQIYTIADIADDYGGGYVDITNRANLQIREIKKEINIQVLQQLQKMKLGSINPAVDHIRNIMTSPIAGVDSQELIDTRPLVNAWDEYITNNTRLGRLSAKFSVGFDGGGKLSIKHFPNDISLIAMLGEDGGRKEPKFFPTGKWGHDRVYLSLHFCSDQKEKLLLNTATLLTPEQCIPVLAALGEVYLQHTDSANHPKPRLREVISNLGKEEYLQQVKQFLTFNNFSLLKEIESQNFKQIYQYTNLPDVNNRKTYHIGIHEQKQVGLYYIGVVLPLGRLQTWQMRGLADLATKYGNSSLRLTPWQNILITNIPQEHIPESQGEISNLGLSYSHTNIKSGLVSCSGKHGCAAAATDNKTHALKLGEYLETQMILDSPINIHFSGCVKSCAQHYQGDITLLGVNIEANNKSWEGYQVYLGNDTLEKFGRQIYENVTFAELPQLIERMLKVYQIKKLNSQESFREFTSRHDISELKHLFTVQSIQV